jgi:Fe-S cluster assembly ATP-binding protein
MTTNSGLSIAHLKVAVEGKEILHDISLQVPSGEVHTIMGPNGAGKSTLATSLMGHPLYEILGGTISLNGQSLMQDAPNERAKKGLFLSCQYPVTIPGVPLAKFLFTAYNELHWNGEKDKSGRKVQAIQFASFYKDILLPHMKLLDMDPQFAERSVNEGLSGGEKKKSEILQLAVLQPSFAILDETDSGLDIDSIRVVAKGVRRVIDTQGSSMGVLVITHYQRILEYLQPDIIHVLVDGKIVTSGGKELVDELEKTGYDQYK